MVNLEPKRLEADAGRRVSNVDWTKIIRQPTFDGRKLKPEDLKPGSSVRRAILRKRLVEICGEKKILEILAMKDGRRLLSRLWDDDATLEDFLLSGPVFNAPLALETLMTLFLNDEQEGWSKTAMGRKATVAVAINAQRGDALVRVSTSGRGDTPEDYPRVSDATPYDPKRKGLFTTRAEDAPWAMVELAGDVEITGVTVVGEAKNLVFWLSDDGEEWRKVGELGMGNGELRGDLRKAPQSARFVKVGFEPGGGKKSLSLKKILVYGNKLY